MCPTSLRGRPLGPRLKAGVTVMVMASLSACSLGPKYVRPDLPVSPSWPVGDTYLASTEAELPALTWRQVFRDPRLQAIIEQGLRNNRDLRIAVANIEAARAQYRIQRADLFPQVDATARYSYSGTGSSAGSTTGTGTGNSGSGTGAGGTGTGTGGNTGTGTGGAGTGTGSGSTGSGGTVVSNRSGSNFQVDLGTTAFELDLFGRVRSLSRAALDRYFAQEAAARATRLTLVGDIATAWLNYAADSTLLQTAQQTAAVAESSVRLTEARLRGGISPRTDLSQAQTILAAAQSDLAEQRTALAQDVNALELLVGAKVDPNLLSRSIDQAAPTVIDVPAGLDSRILLRRPDVVQAEYELRAVNAEIGAARAELFPRISLTGLVGFASSALTSLFTGGAFNYSVAPSISYPLFRAGAGRANVRYTEAQRNALLASYERSIQSAFRETADALARAGTLADQLRANEFGVQAATTTLNLTNARYRGGIDTFLSSLDAQRSLYAAQRTLVATRLIGASNRATLYRVLGGDDSLDVTPDGPKPVTPTGAPRADEPLPPSRP
jgi:multidrug efflux system outer membrane protein